MALLGGNQQTKEFELLVCSLPDREGDWEDSYSVASFLTMLDRTTCKEEPESPDGQGGAHQPPSRSFDSPDNLDVFLDLACAVLSRARNGAPKTNNDVSALHSLEQAMNAIGAADFGVSEADVPDDAIGFKYVYEHRDFTIMMMLMPKGSSLPIHDHPEMTVYSKVLFGKVQVSSFDPQSECKCRRNCFDERFTARPVEVRRNRETWTSKTGTLRTLMRDGNLHQFQALEAACVIDVMSPPYSDEDGGPRECSYYRVGPSLQGCLYAVTVPVPDDYYTVRLPFNTRKGPGMDGGGSPDEGLNRGGAELDQASRILGGLSMQENGNDHS